jgi:hypothetical protein
LSGLYADVTGRIGRYRNEHGLTTTTSGVGGALPIVTASDGVHSRAVELDASLGYRFSQNAGVHVGYRHLKLSHIALAPDNIASANIVTGAGTIALSDATYRGFFAGVQVGW